MSGDVVRNEANAVRVLKSAVERYIQLIQAATAQSRRELMTAGRHAQTVVDQRRSLLQRAEREHQEAKTALAGCKENCGQLEQQVRTATQWQNEAKQRMERARHAAQQVAVARSELMGVLQFSDAAVSKHSCLALSALANLDAKLHALPASAFMSTPAGMIAKSLVTEVAVPAAVEVGAHLAGSRHGLDALHAPGVADTINEAIKTAREALGDE